MRYINQQLSITHEIFQPFDEGFEVRSVFQDISKAFDKVWQKGLIFKLSQNGIFGNLFLIYINNFSSGSSSKEKLIADDTSLFIGVHDINTSANKPFNDLKKISNWTLQWKMSFNPDPNKQAPENEFQSRLKQTSPRGYFQPKIEESATPSFGL